MATTSNTPTSFAARQSGVTRLIAALWLAAHVAVVAAVPVLDARAGHVDRVVAHWEDATDTSCPPQHDVAACQLCQQLVAAGKAPAASAGLAALVRPADRPPPDVRERPHRAFAQAVPSTRAPPAI